MTNEKPRCSVNGSLRGGRAMCGYIIVGGTYCSLKPGECNLQEGALKDQASGIQVRVIKTVEE
jgi:hypothetical protein